MARSLIASKCNEHVDVSRRPVISDILEQNAVACEVIKAELSALLLPVASRIVAAARTAGFIGAELYAGYVVVWDNQKSEHILVKRDNNGDLLFALTEETTLPSLEMFAEDILNNLEPGVSHVLAETASKCRQLYGELQNVL